MESLIITPGKKREEFKELSCGISGRIPSPSIHLSIHMPSLHQSTALHNYTAGFSVPDHLLRRSVTLAVQRILWLIRTSGKELRSFSADNCYQNLLNPKKHVVP
jgi:hypothetical protein